MKDEGSEASEEFSLEQSPSEESEDLMMGFDDESEASQLKNLPQKT